MISSFMILPSLSNLGGNCDWRYTSEFQRVNAVVEGECGLSLADFGTEVYIIGAECVGFGYESGNAVSVSSTVRGSNASTRSRMVQFV